MRKIIIGGITISLLSLSIAGAAIGSDNVLPEITAQEIVNSIYQSFPLSEDGNYILPSGYGGEYITEDGNLVVQLTCDAEWSTFETYAKKYDCMSINEVEYSYDELSSMADEYIHSSPYKFYRYYIDTKQNDVVFKTDEKTCHILNETQQHPAFEFEIGNPIQLCASKQYVYGGKTIVNSSGYSYSSGFCATNSNGTKYLISAGHGMNLRDSITYNGVNIGTVVYKRHGNNLNGDFSAIRLNEDTADITNYCKINGQFNVIYGTYSFAGGDFGKTLFSQGATTGYSIMTASGFSQTIIAYDEDDSPIEIKGLNCANLSYNYLNNIQPGDSGAPVFVTNETTGATEYAGIISGHEIDGNGNRTGTVFYTPVQTIINAGFYPCYDDYYEEN